MMYFGRRDECRGSKKNTRMMNPKERPAGWSFLLDNFNERQGRSTESVGGRRKNAGDQSIAYYDLLRSVDHEFNFFDQCHQMALFPRGLSPQNRRSPILGSGPSAQPARHN